MEFQRYFPNILYQEHEEYGRIIFPNRLKLRNKKKDPSDIFVELGKFEREQYQKGLKYPF